MTQKSKKQLVQEARNDHSIDILDNSYIISWKTAEDLQFFFSVIDQISDAIVIMDHDFRILYVNQAVLDMYQYDRDELLGKKHEELLLSPGNPDVWEEMLNTIKAGDVWSFQQEKRRKNGEIFICECNIKSLTQGSPGKPYLIATQHDITEVVKAQNSLKESEEKFRLLFENAPVAYQSLDGDGNILEVNDVWAAALGYEQHEVIGRNFGEFLHPDYVEHFKTNFPRFKEVGYILGIEFEMVCKDNRVILVSFDGRISHHIDGTFKQTHCIFTDVTKNRQAQNALLRSEERFRRIYEHAGIGIYQSTFEGMFLSMNPALARMLGYDSPREAIDSIDNIAEQVYIDPKQREILLSSVTASMETERFRARLRKRDGSDWTALINLQVLRDDAGKPICLEGFVEDITEIDRIQLALVESEEKHRTLMEYANDCIVVIRDGKIVYRNPAYEKLLGAETADGKQSSFLDRVVPEDRELIKEYYNRHLAGQSAEPYEMRVIGRNGNLLTMEVKPSIIQYQGSIAAMAVMRDITGRKETEKALRTSEQRYKLATEAANVGIWDWNADQNVLYVDPRIKGMLGYSPDQEMENIDAWQELLHPDDFEKTVKVVREHMAGKTPGFEVDHRILHRDNTYRWFTTHGTALHQEDGTLYRVVGTSADITDKKKAEEALGETEAKYGALFDLSEDGIMLISFSPDGSMRNILETNEAFCRLTGYSKSEIQQLSPWQFVPDSEREVLQRHLETLKREKQILFEFSLRRKDGSTLLVESHSNLVEYKGQTLSISIVRDITGRKQAEAALRQSQERYRDIFEGAEDGIIYTNTKGKILTVNDALLRITGLTREEIVGKNSLTLVKKLLKGENIAKVTRIVRQSLAGKPVGIFELEFNNRQLEISVPRVDSRSGITGIIRDITDRKKAEKAHRASENLLRATLESTADGILVVDHSGRITHLNARLTTMWQLPEQLLGTRDFETFVQYAQDCITDQQSFTRIIKKARKSTKDFSDTLHFKDGRVFAWYTSPLIQGGEITGRVWSFQDVTNREESERALRRSEEKFRLLFENTQEMIYLTDENAKPLWVNNAWKKIIGDWIETPEDPFSLLHPDDRLKAQEAWQALVQHNIPVSDLEYRYRVGNTYKTLETSAFKFQIGEEVQYYVIAHDITERKAAEQALRENEAMLQSIFRSAPIGIGLVSNRNLLWVNDKMSAITGYSNAELTGKSARFLYPDQAEFERVGRDKYAQIELTGTGTIETIWRKKNGGLINVLLSSTPIDPQNLATGVTFTALDITGRIGAERRITEQNRFLQNILESLTHPFTVIDVDTYEVVMANTAACPEGLQGGLFCYELNHHFDSPCDEKDHHCPVRIIKETKKPVTLEHAHFNSAGKLYQVELHGYPVFDSEGNVHQIIEYLHDITERKLAEAALRESEEKYRTLIEQSHDIVYILIDGRFELVNQRFVEVFGIDAEDTKAPDFNFLELVAPVSRPLVEERSKQREEGKEIPYSYEFTAIDKFGNEIIFIASVNYITYRGKLATQGILHDITEFKQLEEQFRQAQKMEAVGRLAGGVAHDFNNLLSVITGHSELARLNLSERDPLWKDFQEIEQAALRAANLTRQLLAFSRKQKMELKNLNLNDILLDMKKMLNRIIGEDIEMITEMEADLHEFRADRGQVEQVILNLVVNARDAMPAGGKLILKTYNLFLDAKAARKYDKITAGEFIGLTVEDNGMGMDEKVKARIFDPFFTTKDTDKGTGLGLSTVYGIIKQSGGTITVTSQVKQGSTFQVLFPKVESEEDMSQQDHERIDIPRGEETILVVEDDESLKTMLHIMLTRLGYKAYEVGTAEEALLACEEKGGAFDLVLSDLVLPNMNGIDLSGKLKELWPGMKILIMSGYTPGTLTHLDPIPGDMPFLQKPFDYLTIGKKIREILDR